MKLHAVLAVAAFPALLMGCVETAAAPAKPDAPAKPADLSTCGGDTLQSLIGQNAAALDLSKLAPVVRILAPGQPATMDYNAERLNVMTDDKGVITTLSCG